MFSVGRTTIDQIRARQMKPGSSAVSFDVFGPGALVTGRFAAIVMRDRIDSWQKFRFRSKDLVSRTHDRRGIHSSAELREDRSVRTKPPSDGLREQMAEGLLVVRVGPACMRYRVGFRLPKSADTNPIRSNLYPASRAYASNLFIWCLVWLGIRNEIARDIRIVQRPSSALLQRKLCQVAAPEHVILRQVIIQRTRRYIITRQRKSVRAGLPDRASKIAA